ncbi:MAG: hypothetical protein WDW38_002590 [Sanguina aurantia]
MIGNDERSQQPGTQEPQEPPSPLGSHEGGGSSGGGGSPPRAPPPAQRALGSSTQGLLQHVRLQKERVGGLVASRLATAVLWEEEEF